MRRTARERRERRPGRGGPPSTISHESVCRRRQRPRRLKPYSASEKIACAKAEPSKRTLRTPEPGRRAGDRQRAWNWVWLRRVVYSPPSSARCSWRAPAHSSDGRGRQGERAAFASGDRHVASLAEWHLWVGPSGEAPGIFAGGDASDAGCPLGRECSAARRVMLAVWIRREGTASGPDHTGPERCAYRVRTSTWIAAYTGSRTDLATAFRR